MIDQDNLVRKKFLLGLSLSEIAFIYFIIILLVSLSHISNVKKDKRRISEELDNLTTQSVADNKYIVYLQTQLGFSEEEQKRAFAERQIDLNKLKKEVYAYKSQIEDLDKIKEKLELDNMTLIVILNEFSEMMKQLEKYGSDNDPIDDKISDLLASSEKFSEIMKQLEKYGSDNDPIDDKISDLLASSEEFSEIMKQLEKYGSDNDPIDDKISDLLASSNKKGDGDGHGPAPCFFSISEENKRTDKKKADYMYKIQVDKKRYVIEPIWKKKDKENMEEIWNLIKEDKDLYKLSSASSRKRFSISLNDFDKLGKIIFEHGEANECKHHAVVERGFKLNVNGAPDGEAYRTWDNNYKIIDNYFYNYCPPCLRK